MKMRQPREKCPLFFHLDWNSKSTLWGKVDTRLGRSRDRDRHGALPILSSRFHGGSSFGGASRHDCRKALFIGFEVHIPMSLLWNWNCPWFV